MEPSLVFLWLEITQTCNLQCTHCYAESSPFVKHRDIVDWESILSQARKLGCQKLQFIGGEPTVHPRLRTFISAADRLGYSLIEVYTNLVRTPQPLLEDFARLRVDVATSFYSVSAERHDNITLVPGSFVRTVQGIRDVLALKIPLRVGLVEFSKNPSDAQEAVKFLVELGVRPDRIHVDKERPVGRGGAANQDDDELSPLCGHCWRGKLTVSWDGSCYPCVFARRTVVGNVMHQTLASIVSGFTLEGFRQRSFAYDLRQRNGAQLVPWTHDSNSL